MTTIAYKDGVLAADRKAQYGGVCHPVCKVRRLPDGSLAGVAGNFAQALEMIAWLEAGTDSQKFPASQRTEDWAPVLVARPDGRIQIYETTPFPIETRGSFIAIGSGKEYAMMAMYLGKTAAEAVDLSAVFDSGTGMGVDTLELDSAPA